VLSASRRGVAGRPALAASRRGRGPGGRQGRDETVWRRHNGAWARWNAASRLADASFRTPMRRSRRGRSPPRTSSSASDRLGCRGHSGDAGAGVPHAGDADWCSAPPAGGWRDAQHWQRRVGGVAPVDDKVGKRRVGDAATAHWPCRLRRSGAGAPSCGLESRGVRRRTAGTPEPIVNVDESPAGRRPNADAVPAGAVGVSPVGRCPFSARWLSAAMARRHWRRRQRGREMCEAASHGPAGASCRPRCSRAPRSALRQWGAVFVSSGRRVEGR